MKQNTKLILVKILVLVGLSLVIGIAGFFSLVGVLFGNAWWPSYDSYQWLATKITWGCFLGALIVALFSRYKLAAVLALVGVLAVVFTYGWSPTRDQRKTQANLQRIIDKNEALLSTAVTIAECNNGQRAVLSKRKHARKNGSEVVIVSLSLMDADVEKPAYELVYATGEAIPRLDKFRDYLQNHSPQLSCNNQDYPDLDSMLSPVIKHHYQQRPSVYPNDPLYTKAPQSHGVTPIDPLDLSMRADDVNRANEKKRAQAKKPYSFIVKRRSYTAQGEMSGEKVEFVKGNANNLIYQREEDTEPKMVRVENGTYYQYLPWDIFMRDTTDTAVAMGVYGGSLDLNVNGEARMFSWGKSVVHHGRSSHEYVYEKTTALQSRDLVNRYEYIVDDESGMVALARVLEDGIISKEEVREFQVVNEKEIETAINAIINRPISKPNQPASDVGET